MATGKLLEGTGYTVYQGPDGFRLDIDSPAGSGGSASHPFKVRLSGLKFKVVPGTVNSKMPKLDGTALDAATAPEKTISASGHVYLKCKHTAGVAFPDTVTVEYDASVPADDDTYGYVDLATIVVASGSATKTAQSVMTSLGADRLKCGSSTAGYFFARS